MGGTIVLAQGDKSSQGILKDSCTGLGAFAPHRVAKRLFSVNGTIVLVGWYLPI